MALIKFFMSVFIVGLILAAASAAGAYLWLQNEMGRAGAHASPTPFIVQAGEGVGQVANRLEAEGLIRNAFALRLTSRFEGLDQAVKVGHYQIPARVSAAEILEQLVAGDVIQLRLTLPEGLTTAQILRRIEASDQLQGEMPETIPAEGSLLPDTYLFDVGTTRAALIDRMAQAQTDLLAKLWAERADDLPLNSPAEAVILASIVEKETGRAEERPLIAGLFTQRLRTGMRLESDPTIIYGVSGGEPLVNRRGERRTLYRSEIDRRTDWNTYQIDGLPKTAICNPGREAIAAVLNPPQTDYVFFVADGAGGHKFAATYAEHQRNVAAYRAYERAEIARERGN